jgi:hypothetical protein
MSIIAQLASDDVLDSAYAWLCRRRRGYSANSDVWSFRRGWLCEKAQIKDQLLSGNYRFSLLGKRNKKDRLAAASPTFPQDLFKPHSMQA